MQPDVDEILNAGKAIQFDDRDGNPASFDLVTARHFNETDANRVLYVHSRQWEKSENQNTTGTTYNGFWVYPTFIYVESKPGEDDDYTDFTEAQNAMEAFIKELIAAEVDWELGEDSYYEAQVGPREMIAADIEIKKFATRRF